MTDRAQADVAYIRQFEVRRPDGTILSRVAISSTMFVRIRELLHPEPGEPILGAAEVWLQEHAGDPWQHIATQHDDGHLTWSNAELADDA